MPHFQHNVTSTTNCLNELYAGYSDELLSFAAISCIVFIVIGMPGNILTIVALARGKQTRNSTAIFIINLSLSDLLFGCFNLPLAASTFFKRCWTYSDLLCRLFPLLRYALLAVSLFTISLITINRYIIIAHPRQYPRIYQRRYLILMVAATWVAAFISMIPTWFGIWGRLGLDVEIGSCSILHDHNDRSPKEFLFVAAFLVPCVCIVFCYARIFYLVRQAAMRSRESPTTPTTKVTPLHSEEKATAMVPPKSPHQLTPDAGNGRPFFIAAEDIEFIDVGDDCGYSYCREQNSTDASATTKPSKHVEKHASVDKTPTNSSDKPGTRNNPIKTSLKTSFTRLNQKKLHYVSIGNASNASSIYPGRMSAKDRRLLKMILVIFVTFVICYLPITVTKIWKSATDIHFFNICGYLLIYMTTCINPIIYVLMSSEYRQAYWNLLRCQCDPKKLDFNRKPKS